MTKTILTIGTFDGVHLGHQRLLNKVSISARRNSMKSVVITYDKHPSLLLRPQSEPKLLTPTLCKVSLIEACGIDEVVLLPFTTEFSQLDAKVFLREYILQRHDPALIVMGYDSHFGHGRKGNYSFLKKQRKFADFDTMYVSALLHNGKPLSSTMIRTYLTMGDVDQANSLLGRPYRIYGKVVKGKGIGNTLGFPTANINLMEANQLLPRSGIYFCRVYIEGAAFFGLTNIGTSPTLKSTDNIEVETFIIDYHGDVYDKEIEIDMLKRLRDEKKFGSQIELVDAMRQDLARARQLIANE